MKYNMIFPVYVGDKILAGTDKNSIEYEVEILVVISD